jgi:hypothetical protein
VKERQAQRDADRQALNARTAAEQAEQAVIRAHAGDGNVKAAEKALDTAEQQARNAALAARGAALRVEQAQAEIRTYHGTHSQDLIREAAPDATGPGDKMLEGVRLILEGDAEWNHQAQVIGQHLIAAGHRPNENQPSTHELAEIARTLKQFAGKVTPPLPHNQAIDLRAREEETARRWKAERNRSPEAA